MKKILVAEDEQNIREFVVINLKRAGYDCVEAASGEEALRVYEQAGGDFDVAVLDIMMPGSLDGLAVCKELRQKNATIGIIMLTAKTQEMDKVTGLMMGADDYVTKPFSPSELVARVDAVYRRVAQFTRAAEPNFSEELHSGSLDVDSEEGMGTTVIITIPTMKKLEMNPELSNTTQIPTATAQVQVVERKQD